MKSKAIFRYIFLLPRLMPVQGHVDVVISRPSEKNANVAPSELTPMTVMSPLSDGGEETASSSRKTSFKNTRTGLYKGRQSALLAHAILGCSTQLGGAWPGAATPKEQQASVGRIYIVIVDSKTIAAALDADQLLKEAAEISGLSDFGDPHSIEALRAMVKCFAQDIRVDAGGLNTLRNTTIRHLVNRARFARDIALHPEILDEDVSDPIIILGQPRSGTTKTHRMMGVDPNLLKTYMWQLTNPAPFPDAEPGKPDPRIAAANLQEELIQASTTNEALRAGHLYASEEVQSDIILFTFTFNCSFMSTARPFSASYYEYIKSRTIPSNLDNYKYVKSLFQYLQWQQGGRRGRRWLMKQEHSHGFLDEVLTVWPKATLMFLHRDPRVTIPSLIKLWFEAYKSDNPNVTPAEMAPLIVRRQLGVMNDYLEARKRLGLDDRIYDVPYEQIRSNPMPVFREFYRRAGHTLTPQSEELMLQYERANEQGKHGAHSYSLEQFGLTEEMIRRDFGAYIDRFIEA